MILQSLFATIFQFKILSCWKYSKKIISPINIWQSNRLYMHMTGVNYGMDGKKITDKICSSII